MRGRAGHRGGRSEWGLSRSESESSLQAPCLQTLGDAQRSAWETDPPGSPGVPPSSSFYQFLGALSLKLKVAQSLPTLCGPVDYTVHGILQARILEWVAVPFSREGTQALSLDPVLSPSDI